MLNTSCQADLVIKNPSTVVTSSSSYIHECRYIYKYPHTHPHTLPQGLGKTKSYWPHAAGPLVDSSNSLHRRATGSIPSLWSLPLQRPGTLNHRLTSNFKSKRHLSEDEGKQSGKKDEAKNTKHFQLELSHCKRPRDPGQHLWLKGRDGAPHGLEFLITRGVQEQEVIIWGEGGKERAIRKNIHLEFLLFFASLHFVTKYISARSHILVQ